MFLAKSIREIVLGLLPDHVLRLERKVDMLTKNVCKLVACIVDAILLTLE